MDQLEKYLQSIGAGDLYVDEKRREEIADYAIAMLFDLPPVPLPNGYYELFDGTRISVEAVEAFRNRLFRLPTKADLVSDVEAMLLLHEAFAHA